MRTFSEPDLIIPALEIISAHPAGITTSQLLVFLRRALKPTGDDLILLDGRNDDRFSQKVRNLRSHSTLERSGYATFSDGKYHITPAGKSVAADGTGIMEAFADQGFSAEQRKKALERKFDTIVVEEGAHVPSKSKAARRSAILKKYAISQFRDADGSIECHGCGFRAESVYGGAYKGMIEIHHKRPLFLNSGLTRIKGLQAALKEVAALCPNCHRIVHRKAGEVLSIPALKRLIATATTK